MVDKRWIRLLALVTFLATFTSAHAQLREYLNSASAAAEPAESRAVLEYVSAQLESLETAEPGRYCGTGLVQYIQRHLHELTPTARAALTAAVPAGIARPTYVNPEFYDCPTAPFRIHFTRTGIDSVRNASTDTAADGIPTYVHIASDVMAHSYELLVDSIGFAPLPSDGPNGGGSDLFDCYLIRPSSMGFNPNVIGFTTPDTTTIDTNLATGVITAASFLVVHPTMAGFPQLNDPLDLMRLTCAHELFHAFHYALDIEEKPNWQATNWWQEGTSTWFEDYAYPDVNDWTNIGGYMVRPWESIMTSIFLNDLHPYGGGSMWVFYLVERFGGTDIIRQIWQQCGQFPGDNTIDATNAALNARSTTLRAAWLQFANWCMRTGAHWDDSSFAQGADWPEPVRARVYFNYPQASLLTDGADTLANLIDPSIPVDTVTGNFPARRLEGLAFMPIAYLPFPTTTDSMRFFAERKDTAAVSFFYGGKSHAVYPERIKFQPFATGVNTLVSDWLDYDSLFMVAVGGPRFVSVGGTFEIATNMPVIAAALDTRLDTGEGIEVLPPYPNPVNLARGEGAKFELTLLNPHTIYIDIFSMSGDRVRSLVREDAVSTVAVFWDGTNDQGNPVASGLYLCRVKVGTTEEVYRVGILR